MPFSARELLGKPWPPSSFRDGWEYFRRSCHSDVNSGDLFLIHYGTRAVSFACSLLLIIISASNVQNYTHMGFKKIKAPPEIFKMIKEFWDKNKDKRSLEQWGVGNTYTNNWASPTYMVSVEDSKLRGGGAKLKQQIWDSAYDTVSRWTEQQLTECSLYGIRVYTEGAVLATHVDRLPLVSSAIINVASDLDEPWPLEVYGHDGYAYNVTMEPGDMVLYESHSVLHGRPFPLKGRFVANIFM
jgi:prolyl 4-hydroxylase